MISAARRSIPNGPIGRAVQHGQVGKSTSLVAFRYLPVVLAMLLSAFSLLWIANLQPGTQSLETINIDGLEMNGNELNQEVKGTAGERNTLSPVFTQEVQHWTDDIQKWSSSFSLDPNLVAVVMQIESCGHPDIQSPAGALGLFQVMPFHFHEDDEALDPSTNAKRGLTYLRGALEISDGDLASALAGYNGGHALIEWAPELWPDETKRYVYWGTGILEDINAGFDQSPRLKEWLSSGGASLCAQAKGALGS